MTKLAALALVLAAGCIDAGGTSSEPKQHIPEASNPTFTLYVSNQSFDREIVDIAVSIDGQLAVTGDFDVLTQHNWYAFKFALPAGAHQVTVASTNANATLATPLAVDPHHFGVLNYWWDAGTDEPAHFSWFTSAEQPGFD